MPINPSSRGTLAAILAMAVICLATTTTVHITSAGLGLPDGLRMTLVAVTCLLTPGLLSVLAWPRALGLDVLELVPAGFAVNLIATAVLCVLAFEAGLNISIAIWIVLLWGWVLLGLLAYRIRRRTNPVVSVDLGITKYVAGLFVLLVLASIMTYRIGGLLNPGEQPDREEEAEQIGIIEKIDVMPALSPANVMYMPDVPTTYFYPTYPFALAMVSHAANVEPILTFDKFRGLATFLAVLSFYAAGHALFGSGAIARVILAACLVMVFSGQASHPVAGYYWGLLAPDAHEADFGLGITILLEIFFVVRFLRSERSERFFLVGAPLLLLASMTLHAREVAQIISYVGAFAVLVFVFRRDDRGMLARSLALIVVSVVIARGYQAMVDQRVGHIAEIEAARAAFQRIYLQDAGSVSDLLKPGGIGDVFHLLSPVPALALVAVPVLLFMFPRHPGVLFVCGGVLFWTTVTSFAVLERYLALASYSEIIMTPTRYVHHFGFLTIGLLVFGFSWSLCFVIANRSRLRLPSIRIPALSRDGRQVTSTRSTVAFALLPTGVVIAAFSLTQTVGLFVLEFVSDLMASAGAQTLWAVSVALTAVVALLVIVRRLRGRSWDGLDLRRSGWALPSVGPWLLAPPLVALYFASPSPSLWTDFQKSLQSQDLASFDAWYAASPVSTSLPPTVRRALVNDEPGRLVAAEGADEPVLTMFTADYVLNSGSQSVFSTDLAYVDQWAALQPTAPDYAAQIDWDDYRKQLQRDDFDASTTRAIEFYDQYRAKIVMMRGLLTTTRPLFSEQEPDDTTLRYLSAWRVDYVLADPARHQRLVHLLEDQPQKFSLVADGGSRRLYRVNP